MIDWWFVARVISLAVLFGAVLVRHRERRKRHVSTRWFREHLRSELTRGWQDGPRWKLPAEIEEDKAKRP